MPYSAQFRSRAAIIRSANSSANDLVIIEGISGLDTSLGWVGYAFFVENAETVAALEVDGGETSLDNLVHLCRTHHSQLHRGCFNIHVEKSATTQEPQMVFSTPSGQEIPASFFPQFPDQSVTAAEEALGSAAPDVDANTAVTRWRGEDCDYAMAVEVLLQRDGKLGCSPTLTQTAKA